MSEPPESLAVAARALMLTRGSTVGAVEYHAADDGTMYAVLLGDDEVARWLVTPHPSGGWALVNARTFATECRADTPAGLVRGGFALVLARALTQEAAAA